MASDKDASKSKSKEVAVPDREATDPGADGEVAVKPPSRFGFLLTRKMLMLVVAPAVLLLVAGSAFFFLFPGGEAETVSGDPGGHGDATHAQAESHPVFFEVPDILVNVTSSGGKPVYLKLAVSLELEGADETASAHLEPIMPRVVDQLQTYLRELRIEDLSGSAAMFRLKEELLRRVNLAAEPVKVKSVLFREMIIQ